MTRFEVNFSMVVGEVSPPSGYWHVPIRRSPLSGRSIAAPATPGLDADPSPCPWQQALVAARIKSNMASKSITTIYI